MEMPPMSDVLSWIRAMHLFFKILILLLWISGGAWILWGKGKPVKDEKPGKEGVTINAPGATFNVGANPAPTAAVETLRDQLRTMLHDVNPGIITAIDSGQPRIRIF